MTRGFNKWVVVATLASAAALLTSAGAASASVKFDLATATGSVGKHDVQEQFSWSNAQLQENVGTIAFALMEDEAYSAVCGGGSGPYTERGTRHFVLSQVTFEARRNPRGQVTRFDLTGRGVKHLESHGDAPVVGSPCPSLGTLGGGTWISVELTAETILWVEAPNYASQPIWSLTIPQ